MCMQIEIFTKWRSSGKRVDGRRVVKYEGRILGHFFREIYTRYEHTWRYFLIPHVLLYVRNILFCQQQKKYCQTSID